MTGKDQDYGIIIHEEDREIGVHVTKRISLVVDEDSREDAGGGSGTSIRMPSVKALCLALDKMPAREVESCGYARILGQTKMVSALTLAERIELLVSSRDRAKVKAGKDRTITKAHRVLDELLGSHVRHDDDGNPMTLSERIQLLAKTRDDDVEICQEMADGLATALLCGLDTDSKPMLDAYERARGWLKARGKVVPDGCAIEAECEAEDGDADDLCVSADDMIKLVGLLSGARSVAAFGTRKPLSALDRIITILDESIELADEIFEGNADDGNADDE